MTRDASPREPARSRVDLLPVKRHALILEHLGREGAAAIHELAEAIGASPSTIRRDLERLEKQGALARTHGGALIERGDIATYEPEAAVAAEIARREKAAIADAVAAEILPGQSVLFDAGSTVLAVARRVAARRLAITAVTNSLAVAAVLAEVPEVHLVVPGGTLKPHSLTLVGAPGEAFLAGITADLAVVGTHAVTGTRLTETSLEVAAMKRAMIAAARRAVVVADSSKFGPPSFCTICDATAADEIVTDDGIALEHLAPLAAAGVVVRVVTVGDEVGDRRRG